MSREPPHEYGVFNRAVAIKISLRPFDFDVIVFEIFYALNKSEGRFFRRECYAHTFIAHGYLPRCPELESIDGIRCKASPFLKQLAHSRHTSCTAASYRL